MPRPKRKKLKFNEESADALLQEVYDETYNIRAQIKRLFTKWEAKVKEGGEVAAIGDQIIKLIGAAAKNQDQKIMLLKFLKEVVYEKNKPQSNSDESIEQTSDSERRSALINAVKQEQDRREKEKKEKEELKKKDKDNKE